MNQTTKIMLITVIAIVIVIGGIIYLWQNQEKSNIPQKQVPVTETSKNTTKNSSVKPVVTTSPSVDTTTLSPKSNYFSEMTKEYTNEQYGFSFKYPEYWKLNENINFPYVHGNWHTESKGMTISLCLPPDGCQDSVIRISVVENGNLKDIISKEKKGNVSIKTTPHQTIIDFDYGEERYKSIVIKDDNNNIFILNGPTTAGRTESIIFDKLSKLFTTFNLR